MMIQFYRLFSVFREEGDRWLRALILHPEGLGSNIGSVTYYYLILIKLLKFSLPQCQCRRQWHPTLVLLPGKSHGWRSLVGCSPWGCQESDTTERLHFHFSLSCIGEGNGNPLQCSCLETSRDRGAWWARLWGCTESDTTEATQQQQQQKLLLESDSVKRKGVVSHVYLQMAFHFIFLSLELLSFFFIHGCLVPTFWTQ